MNSDIRVIDVSTGEDHSEEYSLRKRSQDEGYVRSLEKERYRIESADRHWVASYHDPIEKVSQELSLTETGAIIKLLPYMRFRSKGKLIKDGKPLKQADIQRIFKRGKTATRDILAKLEAEGVISVLKEGRSNVFYISAKFHEKGNVKENERFTKLYQVRTREITDKLALHEAGILFKGLPYFHYERCALCANPNEQNLDKIEYIDREELASLIGLNKNDVSRTVTKLRGLGGLMSTRSGSTTIYYVHPDVMYRQSTETEWASVVRKMFEAHQK